MDEELCFLTFEQIHALERMDLSKELADDFNPTGPLYMGVDVARHRHLMVFWIVEELLGLYWTRAVIAMHNAPWKDIDAMGYRLMRLPNMRRCCIDRTGIGDKFAEEMADKFGKHRVEGVTFNASTKDRLESNLRQEWVLDRRVFIPCDADIVNDLHSIKRTSSGGGNVRYLCEEEDGGKGEGGSRIVHHADYFWGLALCRDAAGTKGKAPAGAYAV
jgi:phage FluMu gp28-like protein